MIYVYGMKSVKYTSACLVGWCTSVTHSTIIHTRVIYNSRHKYDHSVALRLLSLLSLVAYSCLSVNVVATSSPSRVEAPASSSCEHLCSSSSASASHSHHHLHHRHHWVHISCTSPSMNVFPLLLHCKKATFE